MSRLLRFGPICAVLLAAPASGQVTIDLQALQALPGHNETSGASHYTGRRAAPPRRRAVARALPLPPIPPGEGTAVAATPAPTEAVPPQPAPHTPPRPTAPPAHGPAVAIGPLPTLPPAPPGPPAPVAPPQEPAGAPAVGQAAPQTAVVSFTGSVHAGGAGHSGPLGSGAHGGKQSKCNCERALPMPLPIRPIHPLRAADITGARPGHPHGPNGRRCSIERGFICAPWDRQGPPTGPWRTSPSWGPTCPATAQADAGKGKQQDDTPQAVPDPHAGLPGWRSAVVAGLLLRRPSWRGSSRTTRC